MRRESYVTSKFGIVEWKGSNIRTGKHMGTMRDTTCQDGAMIIGGDFHGLGIARNLAAAGIPAFFVEPGFCLARFSRYQQACYKCPPLTNCEEFTDFLLHLATRKNLGKPVLFPVSDTAVQILSKNRDRLSEHYRVPTPAWEFTRLAYDKKLTYKLALEIGVPIPRTRFPGDETDLTEQPAKYPVILKPAITANFYPLTHLKAIRANNPDELLLGYRRMAAVIDRQEIMVQEVIAGGPKNLYSFCSLFGNGAVKAKIMAVRLRQHPMDFGSASTYVVTCNIPQLEELSTRMLRAMNYYGLSEVEFMFDESDGTFRLIDINPRTWAWHTLGAKAGVNFSALLFRDMHDASVQVESFETGVIWIREVTDVPTAVVELLKRRLSLSEYFRTLKGKKELAVFSWDDPWPFMVELFRAPVMWLQRGFRM